MSGIMERINIDEVRYFYTSPDTLIDNGDLSSFGLIRSVIEIMDYYGVKDFTAEDARELFRAVGIVRRSNGRLFAPSAKKIAGVLDCYVVKGKYSLSYSDGAYHIESWDHTGYSAEIDYAKSCGKL